MAGWKRWIPPGPARVRCARPGMRGSAPLPAFRPFGKMRASAAWAILGPKTRSAGHGAALFPDLGDLGQELVVEVVGRARYRPVADQVERRSLQAELLREVLAFLQRLGDGRVRHVLLELRHVEAELCRDAKRLLFVGLARRRVHLLMHLEIFSLLAGGKNGLRRPFGVLAENGQLLEHDAHLLVFADELD